MTLLIEPDLHILGNLPDLSEHEQDKENEKSFIVLATNVQHVVLNKWQVSGFQQRSKTVDS